MSAETPGNPSQPQTRPGTIPLRSKLSLQGLPAIENGSSLLADSTVDLPKELVRGLIHCKTKCLLGGASKAGKSWTLIDLAVSVATGTDFLKWPTVQGPVLYVDFEFERPFFRNRLLCHLKKRGLPEELPQLEVMMAKGCVSSGEDFLASLIGRVKDKGYALIILDPYYKLMGGTSESSASSVGRFTQGLDRLIRATGASVVISHHFTKGNQASKKPMDRFSGSGVFARDADTMVTFTEHAEANCLVVETTLRNMAPTEPFVVAWEFPRMVLRPDLNASDLQTREGGGEGSTSGCLLALIQEEPMTTGAWEYAAKDAGLSRATFYRHKRDLQTKGKITFDPASQTWSVASASEVVVDVEVVEPPSVVPVDNKGSSPPTGGDAARSHSPGETSPETWDPPGQGLMAA